MPPWWLFPAFLAIVIGGALLFIFGLRRLTPKPGNRPQGKLGAIIMVVLGGFVLYYFITNYLVM